MSFAEGVGEMAKFVGWQDKLLVGTLAFVGLILLVVAFGSKKKK